jgi:hypothetical protein
VTVTLTLTLTLTLILILILTLTWPEASTVMEIATRMETSVAVASTQLPPPRCRLDDCADVAPMWRGPSRMP